MRNEKEKLTVAFTAAAGDEICQKVMKSTNFAVKRCITGKAVCNIDCLSEDDNSLVAEVYI